MTKSPSSPRASTPTGSRSLSPLRSFPIEFLEFDCYSANLKGLSTIYLSSGSATFDYPALYAELKRRQASKERSFELKRFDYSTLKLFQYPAGDIELKTPRVVEPMGGTPLGRLFITGSSEKLVKFEANEWPFASSMKPGDAYVGKINWNSDDDDECGYAYPKSAKGYIKIRLVWENNGYLENYASIWEGFWEVKVKYDRVLRSKGHGEGKVYRESFWAIQKSYDNESGDEEEEADKDNNEAGTQVSIKEGEDGKGKERAE